MQIREVPITPVEEGSTELEDEAEWIYKQAFLKPPVSKADPQEARERSRRLVNFFSQIRTVFGNIIINLVILSSTNELCAKLTESYKLVDSIVLV